MADQKKTGFEDMSNSELIDAFLSTYESENTKATYRIELVALDTILNGKPFKEVSKLDLINYNQALKTKSDATRQRQHATVRSFFKWLVWAGVIWEQDNPAKGTFKRITPRTNVASKCLLKTEVERMMKYSYPNARDHAMIMVISTTGVRISELINMQWSDMFQAFDENTQQLEWFIKVVAKGNKVRNVWLREDVVAALTRLNGAPIDPNRDGYVFTRTFKKTVTKFTRQGARKSIKTLAEKVGIKDEFTPHWFRHTFASLGTSNGAPVREMQSNMGHASIKTTEIYLWKQNAKVAKFFPATFRAPDEEVQ